ncbi:MAG: DUF4260 domain-containing protein [Pseudomonadota bacterium]
MKLKNPFAAPDFDMQDIRGDHYAVFNPARNILRWEGMAYLALTIAIYQSLGFSWVEFTLFFFAPDLAILAYVFANERVGMYAYNMTHSSVGAALVGLLGVVTRESLCWQISLIWFAHIGFDRALGYGLKYPMGFRVTHLGVLKGMAARG